MTGPLKQLLGDGVGMQAALYGKTRAIAVIFKKSLRTKAVDDRPVSVIGRMVIDGCRRNPAGKTQSENDRVTKPFLRGEHRSLLDR